MLGTKIFDEDHHESKYGSVDGLGLLDMETRFDGIEKVITQSKGSLTGHGIFKDLKGELVNGYELHEGTSLVKNSPSLMKIDKGFGNDSKGFDGAVNGLVSGTYLHGIFHNFKFRRAFTDHIRSSKGMEKLGFETDDFEDMKRSSIERLADIFVENVDMSIIDAKLADIPRN